MTIRNEMATMLRELRRIRKNNPERNVWIPRRQMTDHRILHLNRIDYEGVLLYEGREEVGWLISILERWRDLAGDVIINIQVDYDAETGSSTDIYMYPVKEGFEIDKSYYEELKVAYKAAEYYDRSKRNARIRQLEAELRSLQENNDGQD